MIVAHTVYGNESLMVTENWMSLHSALRWNIPAQGQFDLTGKVKYGALAPCSLIALVERNV